MTWSWCLPAIIAVVTVCFQVTCSSPTLDQHQLELKQHYEHLAYIAEFKCHTPQPRVISINKLLLDSETQDKAYFPDVTVLHRCSDSTGCCAPGFRCDPSLSDSVVLPFKVTFLEDIEHHRKGSWAMTLHTFENHTECACNDGINPRR